jgi:hypothetical protein
MKRFIIEDLSEVAAAMYDEIVNRTRQHVVFIGYYDEAIAVMKELMVYDGVYPYNIDIQEESWSGYEKEYYVELDDNLDLWVSPAWYAEKEFYLMVDTDIAFITGDCNSMILKTIRTDSAVEVVYADEIEEDCCGNCSGTCDGNCKCHEEPNDHAIVTHVAVSEDGRIHGFEKSWTHNENGMHYVSSYTHYSNDENFIKELMENFNIKIK